MGQANAQLWGVVGSEPKTREINGSIVMTISVATDCGKKGKEVTTWWSIEQWFNNDSKNVYDYLSHAIGKGAKVYASGIPSLRSYMDKNGVEQKILELKSAHVQVIVPAPKEPELYDESLPF